MFAAAALRRIGQAPLILDLWSNGRDDEHLLALFKVDGHWGRRQIQLCRLAFSRTRSTEACANSPCAYFEQYYNIEREKTLRGYTGRSSEKLRSIRLADEGRTVRFDCQRTETIRRVNLIPAVLADRLSPVDERSYQAGLAGADPKGLFRPAS